MTVFLFDALQGHSSPREPCVDSGDAIRKPSLSMHALYHAIRKATNLGECRALLGHYGRNISGTDRRLTCAVEGRVGPPRLVLATPALA